jgi:hypothetical protein
MEVSGASLFAMGSKALGRLDKSITERVDNKEELLPAKRYPETPFFGKGPCSGLISGDYVSPYH